MFAVHCQICDKEYLVGYRSIRSLHNTDHGPLGLVDPPCGHPTVHSFRTERSVPVDHLPVDLAAAE